MSIFSRLRLVYLCHFSQPTSDRPLYRAIRRQRAAKIVEVGIGDGHRALRMIEVARKAVPGCEVHYVGLDLFEAATEVGRYGISLKSAHQLLRGAGAKVQLVPGAPVETLTRLANSLGKVDLLILPAELDAPSQSRLWYFVPRMLHERSLVLIDSMTDDGQPLLRTKPQSEIDYQAAASQSRCAA